MNYLTKCMGVKEMKELSKALVKFQSIVPLIPKNQINPFFSKGENKAMYADLATIIDVCKKSLADCGLCISQTMDIKDGITIIKTSLIHISGELLESILPLPPIPDAQKLTAAVTYFRRTQYVSILGVCPDTDDDGNLQAELSKGNNTQNNQQQKTQTKNLATQAQVNALKNKFPMTNEEIRKIFPSFEGWEKLTFEQTKPMFDFKK